MPCAAPLRAVAFALVAAAVGHATARLAAAQVTIAGGPNPGTASGPVSGPYLGVQINVYGSDSYDRLTFNFFSYPDAASPVRAAVGTAFLLSAPFYGSGRTTPNALGPAIPEFIAASTAIVDGRYVFDPGVTVVGGQRYFIHINAPIPDPQLSGQGHTLPGFTSARGPDQPFEHRPYASIAHHLQGFTVAVVPEPGTWALLGTGLLAVGGARVRRRRPAAP